jgi:hypothetical protein
MPILSEICTAHFHLVVGMYWKSSTIKTILHRGALPLSFDKTLNSNVTVTSELNPRFQLAILMNINCSALRLLCALQTF